MTKQKKKNQNNQVRPVLRLNQWAIPMEALEKMVKTKIVIPIKWALRNWVDLARKSVLPYWLGMRIMEVAITHPSLSPRLTWPYTDSRCLQCSLFSLSSKVTFPNSKIQSMMWMLWVPSSSVTAASMWPSRPISVLVKTWKKPLTSFATSLHNMLLGVRPPCPPRLTLQLQI